MPGVVAHSAATCLRTSTRTRVVLILLALLEDCVHALFQGFTLYGKSRLVQTQTAHAGAALTRAGEPFTRLLLLASGSVRLLRNTCVSSDTDCGTSGGGASGQTQVANTSPMAPAQKVPSSASGSGAWGTATVPESAVSTGVSAGVRSAMHAAAALERRGAGQLVGDDALVHNGVHACTAVAEASTEAYVLNAQVCCTAACVEESIDSSPPL